MKLAIGNTEVVWSGLTRQKYEQIRTLDEPHGRTELVSV